MLAYGGNGPAFAAIQAEDLGIDRVLVPKASPTFSALGTLVANPTHRRGTLLHRAGDPLDLEQAPRAVERSSTSAPRSYFSDANFSRQQVVAKYQLNMRYPGQNWSLTFDIKTNGRRRPVLHRRAPRHERDRAVQPAPHGGVRPCARGRNSRDRRRAPVDVCRHADAADGRGFTAAKVAARSPRPAAPTWATGYQKTNIYRGADLKPGHEIAAPAIIEETFTTIVVYPGWKRAGGRFGRL